MRNSSIYLIRFPKNEMEWQRKTLLQRIEGVPSSKIKKVLQLPSRVKKYKSILGLHHKVTAGIEGKP